MTALIDKEGHSGINKRAITMIVAELGSSHLRTIQDGKNSKAACSKLQTRYSGKTKTDEFGLLLNLFNLCMSMDQNICDHVSYLESQLTRLQVLQTTLEEPVKWHC